MPLSLHGSKDTIPPSWPSREGFSKATTLGAWYWAMRERVPTCGHCGPLLLLRAGTRLRRFPARRVPEAVPYVRGSSPVPVIAVTVGLPRMEWNRTGLKLIVRFQSNNERFQFLLSATEISYKVRGGSL